MTALPMERLRLTRALPLWAKYAAACIFVLAAFVVRLAINDFYHYPFLTFIPVVLAAALLFDRGTGVVAALLSAAAASYFVKPEGVHFGWNEALALAAFVGFGVATAAVIETLTTMIERLEAANQRLAEAESAARDAEARQAVLLEDVGHRLKNSLHALAGTLHMDAARMASRRGTMPLGPDAACRALEDAAARLRVLSRVHERLHLATGRLGTTVEIGVFLGALAADLSTTLTNGQPIILRVEAEDIELDVTKAVPIGLIVNELVTNAVKHAFPHGRMGRIEIRLHRSGTDIQLEIEDDGVGLTSKDDTSSGHGTGRRLIEALARQLGGAVVWNARLGTRVLICFPE